MYNKKYKIALINEFNHHNPVYEGMEGRICYPAYLKVGDRGWILYEREDEPGCWPHRLHTSIIKDVQYMDNHISIITENTKILLRVVE